MGGRRFAQLVSNSLSMPMQVPISAASNTFMTALARSSRSRLRL
jgi:hypothetical protein